MLSSLWPKQENSSSTADATTTAADAEESVAATSAGGGAATTTTPTPTSSLPLTKTKNKRAGKQPNTVLRAQFRSYSHENGTKLQWECIHCEKILFSWRVANFNASRANMHIQSCTAAPDHIKRELQGMTQAAKKAGAKVLLLGMQVPPNYGGAYSATFSGLFNKIAKAEKVALMPFFLKGVADVPDVAAQFQADRIHPNAQAQPKMLANVWPELKKLLK